jgi:thiol-disulfide isomerase/thioredoxin
LKKFKGKLVLLDFWETWCGYCIMAMPKLNRLQKEYKKEVNVIGITTQNKGLVKKLIEKNDLVYSNIYADHSIITDYKISNRPTYVLIDQYGKIVTVTYGNLKKIKTKINTLLSQDFRPDKAH